MLTSYTQPGILNAKPKGHLIEDAPVNIHYVILPPEPEVGIFGPELLITAISSNSGRPLHHILTELSTGEFRDLEEQLPFDEP